MNRVRLDFSPSHLLPTIFISHRYSRPWLLTKTRSTLKVHGICQMHWKWTVWGSTSFHLMAYVLPSFHKDTHIAESSTEQHQRWRSTAFSKCIPSEHSEAWLLSISCLMYYLFFEQTLTTLNLRDNNIGDEGAQHLATALQVNTVRFDFSPSHLLSTIFIWHRHSRTWILPKTRSAMKEYSTWQGH